MIATATTINNIFAPSAQNAQKLRSHLFFAFLLVLCLLVLVEPAFAGGSSSATAAKVKSVAEGWQGIITGVGVAVLIVAWSIIGYMIAFSGKTLKDMTNPLIGSTIAGIAPILVSWLFG